MNFTQQPTDSQETKPLEKGVMQIDGRRGRRFWDVTRWLLAVAVVAALMVVLFIRFGATTLWAFGLVGFMLTYMILMGKWAADDQHRR